MSVYFSVIVVMCSFSAIATGIIIGFYRYQKNMLTKQKELHALDMHYKQDLLTTSIQSAEAERIRIAKDVHDEIGSIFSTLSLSISRIGPGNTMDPEHYRQCRNLVQTGITSVRRISHSIVPFEIKLLGLEQTLDHHFDAISSASGMHIHFENTVSTGRLPEDTALALYRIVQELSSNSLKHAFAKTISLNMCDDASQQTLSVSYRDDGVGVDAARLRLKPGIGLKNIESRVLALNGRVHFSTAPGEGFACSVVIPFVKPLPSC